MDRLVMDLGKSVVIKGELSGSEDITLCGQMEGHVKLPGHTLTIGPHADIKAEISAKAVVIMGAVTGNLTAAGVQFTDANALAVESFVTQYGAVYASPTPTLKH